MILIPIFEIKKQQSASASDTLYGLKMLAFAIESNRIAGCPSLDPGHCRSKVEYMKSLNSIALTVHSDSL